MSDSAVAGVGEAFSTAAAGGPLLLALGACLAAGLISFASPCVIPLVPGYVSYLVGISAGGTVAAALEVAKTAREGDVILAMLPDTGERYFSTPLLADINEGSDDDWLAGLP